MPEDSRSSANPARLFPFARRARIVMAGREQLSHARSKIHFILITSDITPPSKIEILRQFRDFPIVQHFDSAQIEAEFGFKNTKVVGFKKGTLAQSIYHEMKPFRIQLPPPPRMTSLKARPTPTEAATPTPAAPETADPENSE